MGNRRSRGDGGAARRQHEANMAAQNAARERARLDAERARHDREMKNKQYEREHQQRMAQIANENARKEREAKAAMERARREHAKRMEQMRIDAQERDKKSRIAQKNANLAKVEVELNKLEALIGQDTDALAQAKEALEKTIKAQQVTQQTIDKFDNYKSVELEKVSDELQLKTAQQTFEDTDKQIKAAIDKTGQIEENVGKFLSLTHNLLDATISTTSHSNKLDAEITTFGELMSRECQDKLTLEQYFGDNNMRKFVAILAEEDFVNVSDLKCADADEYEEILQVVRDGLEELELEKKNNSDDAGDDDEKEEEVEESPEEVGKKLFDKWKLSKFWDAMVDAGYDDPTDWKDITEEELAEMGIVKGHLKKWHRGMAKYKKKNKLLSLQEERLLKDTCMNPDSWKDIEEEQGKAVREGLGVISPLLSEFFTRIHKGIKQSQNMLNYEVNLNDDQLKAIQEVNAVPPKSVEYKPESKNNDDDDGKAEEEIDGTELGTNETVEDAMRNEWKIGDKCELYSKAGGKWMNGEIVSITEDDDGEWLHVAYGNQTKQIGRYSDVIRPAMDNDNKLALQSKALTEASIVSIDVTNQMIDKFNENTLTTRALTVATGVEDCCMQIVKSQGTIRQSVLLAQEILKLRPAHMSDEAKKLWKAVDDGIIRIIKTAINMVRVSSQYFGFFLRFKQSFQFYQSNEDKPFAVSLQHLKTDVKEFTAFQKNFSKTVKELSDEAMNCITQCVETQIGAANFEKQRSSREGALQNWLGKKKIYDKRAMDLDHELDVKQKENIALSAQRAKLEYQVKMLEHQININEDQKKSCIEIKAILNQKII